MRWGNGLARQVLDDLSLLPFDLVSLFGSLLGDPFAPFLVPFSPLFSRTSLEDFVELSDALLALDLASLFSDLLDELLDEPPDALLDVDSPPESLLLATFFLSPDLKSVSYQPPPFRRNATAEIFFLSRSFPHEGHCVSGGSLILCSDSNSYSQPSH
jgi:hypothetical protein